MEVELPPVGEGPPIMRTLQLRIVSVSAAVGSIVPMWTCPRRREASPQATRESALVVIPVAGKGPFFAGSPLVQ
jgi:hypothetical protein